jgi:hypothetical protein
MKYVSHRNITVASVYGISIELKKGVPTFCSPLMHAELLALGVVPAEDMPEEPDVVPGTTEPTNPDVRLKELFAAFETMSLRQKRGDFTGNGSPHLAVLTELMGWKVDTKERDTAWAKFQDRTPE